MAGVYRDLGVSCGVVSAPGRLKTYLELVKFEHTVFALPFAYAGMLLASLSQNGTGWPGWPWLPWPRAAPSATAP